MKVNGIPNIRTCIAPLKEGIYVETQEKFPDWPESEFHSKTKETINVDLLVIGAGPAGLCACIEAAK